MPRLLLSTRRLSFWLAVQFSSASFLTRSSSSAFAGAFTSTPYLHPSARSSLRHKSTAATLPTSFSRAFQSSTAMSASKKSSSNQPPAPEKPRILCLHGKYQSGAIFSNKIAGARRKLERNYDLHFLDGPIRLEGGFGGTTDSRSDNKKDDEPAYYAWWHKDDQTGQHTLVKEGLEYVLQHIADQDKCYDAVIGFSQGGVVATALCCSGRVPSLRAVVTAGSPMVEEAFFVAGAMADNNNNNSGYQNVPKLHMAGETDAMIPVASTEALCERGGHGELIKHDQGHLFPTRSVRVQAVLDFLEASLATS